MARGYERAVPLVRADIARSEASGKRSAGDHADVMSQAGDGAAAREREEGAA
jgi:hypothetical protein